MKIKAKYTKYLFGFIMALIMSCFISLVMTMINVGFVPHFFAAWLPGWGIGFAVSLPLAFFLPGLIGKWLARISEREVE